VDSLQEFRRGDLEKNSLVPICTKFISTAVSSPTITGDPLSGNNPYIKDKRLFAGSPLYRSTSKLNGIFAQHRYRGNHKDTAVSCRSRPREHSHHQEFANQCAELQKKTAEVIHDSQTRFDEPWGLLAMFWAAGPKSASAKLVAKGLLLVKP
jgi:hypothetical protein